MSTPPNNIYFSLHEESDADADAEDIEDYVAHFLQDSAYSCKDTDLLSVIHDYESTCNVKDLAKICDYYGISKLINKLKKLEIIYQVVLFENDGVNADIVLKRKQLWYYIEELKQDKFMKRFVMW
jgi:hypothetical protein